MPNHVTTRCKVMGPEDRVATFLKEMLTKENPTDDERYEFDFNRIISMPEALRGSKEGSTAEQGAAILSFISQHGMNFEARLSDSLIERMKATVNKPDASLLEIAKAYITECPDVEDEGRQRLRNIVDYGYASWYPWSIDNWGTKWNAYDLKIETESPLEFYFDTAWSFPDPIFKKLAEMYRELTFHCVCFDEGWGFAGRGYFNPNDDEYDFYFCDADDEIYEEVYGHLPEKDEDELDVEEE